MTALTLKLLEDGQIGGLDEELLISLDPICPECHHLQLLIKCVTDPGPSGIQYDLSYTNLTHQNQGDVSYLSSAIYNNLYYTGNASV